MSDAREILSEMEGLFRAAFALDAWGRVLFYLVKDEASGALAIADVQVEEIMNEAAVERAFGGPDVRAAIPAVVAAISALSMLAGVDAAEVGGGTFVRAGDRLAFLPGTVRTPSRAFDAGRDDAEGAMSAANRALADKLGVADLARAEIDPNEGRFAMSLDGGKRAEGRAVVLGSFARPRRWWVWGAHNPTLEAAARRSSAELLDHVADRSLWEISTPGFQTDEATAWALAAYVALDRKLEGLVQLTSAEGIVAVGLDGVSIKGS